MAAYQANMVLKSNCKTMIKGLASAALTHAFGCTIDDIADYKLDALVGTYSYAVIG